MADQITEEQAQKLAEQIRLMKAVPTEMLTDVTATVTDVDGMKAHTTAETVIEPQNKPLQDGNSGKSTVSPLNDPGAKNRLNLGKLVSGEKAVKIADFIFPALFVLLIKNTTGRDIEKSKLQTTKDERDLLAPVVSDYLESIQLELTPLNALLICLGVVYGPKVVEVMNEPQTKKPGQQMPVIAPAEKPKRPGTFSSTNQPRHRRKR